MITIRQPRRDKSAVHNHRTAWLIGIVLIFCHFFSVHTVLGQQPTTGGIRGVVTDQEFDVPLGYAIVAIPGTAAKTVTDETGHFALYDLKPDAYTVVIEKDGFERVVRGGVIVTAGALATLDIALPMESVEMQEIVVQSLKLDRTDEFYGGFAPAITSELDLLQLRMESVGIMNAVGANLISRASAGTAADAVKLISGVTVASDKYAVVRGLSDRFLNTLVNGIPVPTADPDVRAVQLDLFPSALLDSIQVQKTFMPDLPGDTSGGSVNIVTRRIPEGRTFQFSQGVSYNSQATGNEKFLASPEGTDYWGLDEGKRTQRLENGGVRQVSTSPRGGFFSAPTAADQAAYRELDRQTRMLSPNLGTTRDTSGPDHSWGLTYGDRLELENGLAIGWLASSTYKNSFSYYKDGVDHFLVASSDLRGYDLKLESSETADDPHPDQWTVEEGKEKVRWGLGTLLGFEYGDHSASLSYLRSQNTEDRATILHDDRTNAQRYWHNQSLAYTARTLDSVQLRGVTPLSFLPEDDWLVGQPRFEWSVARSEATQDQPDRRFFLGEFNTALSTWVNPRVPKNFAERSWRDIAEENEYEELDLIVPLTTVKDKKGEFKIGLSRNVTERRYSQDSVFYEAPSIAGQRTPYAIHLANSFSDLWTDYFLEPQRLGYPSPVGQGSEFTPIIDNEVNWVVQPFSGDVDYTGDMEISANFVMAKVPLTQRWTVVGGVRWEDTLLRTDVDASNGNDNQAVVYIVELNQDLNPGDFPFPQPTLDDLANAEIDQLDVLPALGIIFEPLDTLTLRTNWSRTIARPTFKEITPVRSQEYLNGKVFAGNRSLRMSALENYDLRLEWTPGTGQLLAISGFYKEIQDPIDYAQRQNPGTGGLRVVPFNFKHGEVAGVELEMRQELGWPESLRGLSWGANFTLLEATVQYPTRFPGSPRPYKEAIRDFLLGKGRNPSRYDIDERRMKDQPEYLVNLFFLYDIESTGTSFGLFFNRAGETLIAGDDATDDYIPNRVAKPYNSLDVNVSQTFAKNWKLSLGAENILNPAIEEVWQSDYIPSEALAKSYKKGTTFSLNVSAKW